MEYIEPAALVIIPLIIYMIIMKWLENNYDLELSKFIKAIIFTTLDLVIFLLFNQLHL